MNIENTQIMQVSLLESLEIVSQLDHSDYPDHEVKECAFWLCKIILYSYEKEDIIQVSKLMQVAYRVL